MRDIRFLVRKAKEHGEAVGRYAEALLDSRLPWTRMRQVYKLLSLAKRYGDSRLDHACGAALDVGLVSVYKLQRLLELAPPAADAVTLDAGKVVPIARYLRTPHQFALNLSSSARDSSKGDQE